MTELLEDVSVLERSPQPLGKHSYCALVKLGARTLDLILFSQRSRFAREQARRRRWARSQGL